MKKRQIVKLSLTLGLVAVVGIGGRLAALTATSDSVTNTFAVGKNLTNDDLKLDEYPLNTDNRTANTSGERVTSLNFTNLMQGDTLAKDPMVQIDKDAAKCYVFVKVTGLEGLKNHGITVNWNSNWIKYDTNAKSLDTIYYYKTGSDNIVDPSSLTDTMGNDGFIELPALFTTVSVANNATLYDTVSGNGVTLPKIVATACAVQAQNVKDIEAAYKLLPTDFLKDTQTVTE